jgi:hypothetical protein
MSNLYSTATIQIAADKYVDEATVRKLRNRFQAALNDAADSVLIEFGIDNQEVYTVLVDEVEIDNE